MARYRVEAEINQDQLDRLNREGALVHNCVEQEPLQVGDILIMINERDILKVIHDPRRRVYSLINLETNEFAYNIKSDTTLDSLCSLISINLRRYTLQDFYLEELGPYFGAMKGWCPDPDCIVPNIINNLYQLSKHNEKLYKRAKAMLP